MSVVAVVVQPYVLLASENSYCGSAVVAVAVLVKVEDVASLLISESVPLVHKYPSPQLH